MKQKCTEMNKRFTLTDQHTFLKGSNSYTETNVMMLNIDMKLYLLNIHLCQPPQLKQEFSGELAGLEEALNQERKHIREEMKRLREELQEKHKTELSALRTELDTEMEEERSSLKKALDEEKEKFKSLQAALDNQESKTL